MNGEAAVSSAISRCGGGEGSNNGADERCRSARSLLLHVILGALLFAGIWVVITATADAARASEGAPAYGTTHAANGQRTWTRPSERVRPRHRRHDPAGRSDSGGTSPPDTAPLQVVDPTVPPLVPPLVPPPVTAAGTVSSPTVVDPSGTAPAAVDPTESTSPPADPAGSLPPPPDTTAPLDTTAQSPPLTDSPSACSDPMTPSPGTSPPPAPAPTAVADPTSCGGQAATDAPTGASQGTGGNPAPVPSVSPPPVAAAAPTTGATTPPSQEVAAAAPGDDVHVAASPLVRREPITAPDTAVHGVDQPVGASVSPPGAAARGGVRTPLSAPYSSPVLPVAAAVGTGPGAAGDAGASNSQAGGSPGVGLSVLTVLAVGDIDLTSTSAGPADGRTDRVIGRAVEPGFRPD